MEQRRFRKVKGILNQHGSHSILQHHEVPSGLRLFGSDFTIRRDDEPKRTSEFCRVFLESKQTPEVISIMKPPAQSTHLNPIKLL
ncbi:hypothetical protein C0J50_20362 [Silurus asotus]|uniref:Uncharacterized protein n=1 Tax=Silurus asotus TaxID=30991 RepID=A0AAD5APG8_SILAS|nr:hypothetical protein C0J50_20362 [Silurus asotus]